MDRPPIYTNPREVAMASGCSYTSVARHAGPGLVISNGYGNQASLIAQPSHRQQFYTADNSCIDNTRNAYHSHFHTPSEEQPIPTGYSDSGMAPFAQHTRNSPQAQPSPYIPIEQSLFNSSGPLNGYGIRPNVSFTASQPPSFEIQSSPFHMVQQPHKAAFNHEYHQATPNYGVSFQQPQSFPAAFHQPRDPPLSPQLGQPTQGAAPCNMHLQPIQRSEAMNMSSSLDIISRHIRVQSLSSQVPAVSVKLQSVELPQLGSTFDMDRIVQDAANEAVRQMSFKVANEPIVTVPTVISSASSLQTPQIVSVREILEAAQSQQLQEKQEAIQNGDISLLDPKEDADFVEVAAVDGLSEEASQDQSQSPRAVNRQIDSTENAEASKNVKVLEQKRKGAGRPTLAEELDQARRNPEATAAKLAKKKKELEELKRAEGVENMDPDNIDKVSKDLKKKEREIVKLEGFQRQVREEQASDISGIVLNIVANENPEPSQCALPARGGLWGCSMKIKQDKTAVAKKKAAVKGPVEDGEEETDEEIMQQATETRPGQPLACGNGWGESLKGKKRSAPGSKLKQHLSKRRKGSRSNDDSDPYSSDLDSRITEREDEPLRESSLNLANQGDMDVDIDTFTDVDENNIYSAARSNSYPIVSRGSQEELDRVPNGFLRERGQNSNAAIDAVWGAAVPVFREELTFRKELVQEFGEDACRAFQIQEIATRKIYTGSRVTEIPRQFSHVLICSQSSRATYSVRYIGNKRRQRIVRIKPNPDGTLGHSQLLGIMRFASDALRQEKGCLFLASRPPTDQDLPIMQGILVAILCNISPIVEHRNTTHILDKWRAGSPGRPSIQLNPSVALLDEIDTFMKHSRKEEKKVNTYLNAAENYRIVLKSLADAKRRRILHEKGELDIPPWEFEIFFPPHPPVEYLHAPPIRLDGLQLSLDDLPTDTRDMERPLGIIKRIQKQIDELPRPSMIPHFWSNEHRIRRELLEKKLREAKENCFEEATPSPLRSGDVFV